MQILGTFLAPVGVLVDKPSVLGIMPMICFFSFPPLSQQSPNPTKTFVWPSLNVSSCAHRQLISNISAV